MVEITDSKSQTLLKLFSEIGTGWIPAILLSDAEYDFIAEMQGRLSNNQSYWIGGSTRTTGAIDYIHYLPYHIGPGEINSLVGIEF